MWCRGLPRVGQTPPVGEKEGGGKGGTNYILWSPLARTECAQGRLASLLPGHCKIQPQLNQCPLEKYTLLWSQVKLEAVQPVHFRHDSHPAGGGGPSGGSPLAWWALAPSVPSPSASSRPSAGTLCAVGNIVRWLRQGFGAPRCLEKMLSLKKSWVK